MAIYEIKHPLFRHKLGLMRKDDISTKAFRELSSEIGMLLTYEATRNLPTETIDIECWSGTTQVEQIRGKKITVVPILRAGIGLRRSQAPKYRWWVYIGMKKPSSRWSILKSWLRTFKIVKPW